MNLSDLDLRGSMVECFPRMLWQRLFDIYREVGGDISRLDNLLIDYENCKKVFNDQWEKQQSVVFFWSCYKGHFSTHWTGPTDSDWIDGDVQIGCEVFSDKVTFRLIDKT